VGEKKEKRERRRKEQKKNTYNLNPSLYPKAFKKVDTHKRDRVGGEKKKEKKKGRKKKKRKSIQPTVLRPPPLPAIMSCKRPRGKKKKKHLFFTTLSGHAGAGTQRQSERKKKKKKGEKGHVRQGMSLECLRSTAGKGGGGGGGGEKRRKKGRGGGFDAAWLYRPGPRSLVVFTPRDGRLGRGEKGGGKRRGKSGYLYLPLGYRLGKGEVANKKGEKNPRRALDSPGLEKGYLIIFTIVSFATGQKKGGEKKQFFYTLFPGRVGESQKDQRCKKGGGKEKKNTDLVLGSPPKRERGGGKKPP